MERSPGSSSRRPASPGPLSRRPPPRPPVWDLSHGGSLAWGLLPRTCPRIILFSGIRFSFILGALPGSWTWFDFILGRLHGKPPRSWTQYTLRSRASPAARCPAPGHSSVFILGTSSGEPLYSWTQFVLRSLVSPKVSRPADGLGGPHLRVLSGGLPGSRTQYTPHARASPATSCPARWYSSVLILGHL